MSPQRWPSNPFALEVRDEEDDRLVVGSDAGRLVRRLRRHVPRGPDARRAGFRGQPAPGRRPAAGGAAGGGAAGQPGTEHRRVRRYRQRPASAARPDPRRLVHGRHRSVPAHRLRREHDRHQHARVVRAVRRRHDLHLQAARGDEVVGRRADGAARHRVLAHGHPAEREPHPQRAGGVRSRRRGTALRGGGRYDGAISLRRPAPAVHDPARRLVGRRADAAEPLPEAVPHRPQQRCRRRGQGGRLRRLAPVLQRPQPPLHRLPDEARSAHAQPLHPDPQGDRPAGLRAEPVLLEGRQRRQPTPLHRPHREPAAGGPGGVLRQDHQRGSGLRRRRGTHRQLPAVPDVQGERGRRPVPGVPVAVHQPELAHADAQPDPGRGRRAA